MALSAQYLKASIKGYFRGQEIDGLRNPTFLVQIDPSRSRVGLYLNVGGVED